MSTEPIKHQFFAQDCSSISLHKITYENLEDSLIKVLSRPESVDIQWNMVGGIISLLYLLRIRIKMLEMPKPVIRRKLEREKVVAELKNQYLDVYSKVSMIKGERGEFLAPMEDLTRMDLVPLFQVSSEKQFGTVILDCWRIADSLSITSSNDVYHVRQPDMVMDYLDLGGNTGKRVHEEELFFLPTPTADPDIECLTEQDYFLLLKKPCP